MHILGQLWFLSISRLTTMPPRFRSSTPCRRTSNRRLSNRRRCVSFWSHTQRPNRTCRLLEAWCITSERAGCAHSGRLARRESEGTL